MNVQQYNKLTKQQRVDNNTFIHTCFGRKPKVYADFVATNINNSYIETVIGTAVLPVISNPHSIGNTTSLQATHFINETRKLIKHYINANESDCLLFCGNGATEAVQVFLQILHQYNFKLTHNTFQETRWNSFQCSRCQTLIETETELTTHLTRCVKQCDNNTQSNCITYNHVNVLIDPTCHHSIVLSLNNLRNYVKQNTDHTVTKVTFSVLLLDLTTQFTIDAQKLHHTLQLINESNQHDLANTNVATYVFINAVSNVTGCSNDLLTLSRIVHAHNAIFCVDAASMFGYDKIDVNPHEYNCHIDALFFSIHKVIGGPGTPGILCVKKHLIDTQLPYFPAGGTVSYVSETMILYKLQLEHKNEIGTPNVISIARAGLCINHLALITHEQRYSELQRIRQTFISYINDEPNIVDLNNYLLDDQFSNTYTVNKPCFSIIIKQHCCKTNNVLLLHHSYVATLLNDLFGIQVRAGCSCAAIFAHILLGITDNEGLSEKIDACLIDNSTETIRPGFVRISFDLSTSDQELLYVAKALKFIVKHGWKLLRHYTVNNENSSYTYVHHKPIKQIVWLSSFYKNIDNNQQFLTHNNNSINSKLMNAKTLQVTTHADTDNLVTQETFDEAFRQAETLINGSMSTQYTTLHKPHNQLNTARENVIKFNKPEHVQLLWFVLTQDCVYSQQINSDQLVFCNNLNVYIDNGQGINIMNVQRPKTLCFIPLAMRTTPIAHIKIKHELFNKQSYLRSFNKHFEQVANAVNNTSINAINDNSVTDTVRIDQQASTDVSNTDACSINTIISVTTGSKKCNITNGKACSLMKPTVKKSLTEQDKLDVLRGLSKSLITLSFNQIRKLVGEKNIRLLTKAISTFDMIQPNDKILIGVSGGKDSLSLLQMLLIHQRSAKVKFQIAAATVDPQIESYNPEKLHGYIESLGVKHHMLSLNLVELALEKTKVDSLCSFCARMKRGLLYKCMTDNNYNVLALGQHTDDFCESMLMSLFYNGTLNTMKANYHTTFYNYEQNSHTNIRIIRPLVFIREYKLRVIAEALHLPIITDNCPACFSTATQRAEIKHLIAKQEIKYPHLVENIRTAIMPYIAKKTVNSSYEEF